MAGAGLGPGNIAAVARQTGCLELHASAKGKRRSAMQFQNPALRGLDPDWSQTDTATVSALRKALDG
ncbi:Copper homeostasis protein CutC [compost metagenome]